MVEPNSGNGRVRDVKIQEFERRITNLEEDKASQKELNEAKKDIDDLKKLRVEVARLGERLNLFQIGQGLFTTIGSVIAGILGGR